jgi:hypothetical protein
LCPYFIGTAKNCYSATIAILQIVDFSYLTIQPSPPAFKGMFFILGWFWSRGGRGSRGSRGGKAIVFVVYPSLTETTVKNIHL